MYDDAYIYVPRFHNIIRIAEGSGDNLTQEDLTSGYVDYIYYDVHDLDAGLPEYDGGIIMLTKRIDEQFETMLDKRVVELVLEMLYNDPNVLYVVLEQ